MLGTLISFVGSIMLMPVDRYTWMPYCAMLPFLMSETLRVDQAISVAERVAVERCEPPPGNSGSLVGYQVRLDTAW